MVHQFEQASVDSGATEIRAARLASTRDPDGPFHANDDAGASWLGTPKRSHRLGARRTWLPLAAFLGVAGTGVIAAVYIRGGENEGPVFSTVSVNGAQPMPTVPPIERLAPLRSSPLPTAEPETSSVYLQRIEHPRDPPTPLASSAGLAGSHPVVHTASPAGTPPEAAASPRTGPSPSGEVRDHGVVSEEP
jgi:hypothetical protein